MNGFARIPTPVNEPAFGYAPGSPERASITARLEQMLDERIEIPAIIGGKDVTTGNTLDVVCPHDHGHVLAVCHQVDEATVGKAIEAAAHAWREWSEMNWEARAAVFLKAADLLAGPWRDTMNVATMLGQSKTVHQAEVEAAAELCDFWRFNAHYLEEIYSGQPESDRGMWNYVEYRPLEGFVFAVSPFNFTAIGGNLPGAPALMGNSVLWKPASSAALSNYYVMRLLQEAGLPDGVINFVPGRGARVGDPVFASSQLAGLHFTGSTATFQRMWRTMSDNLETYGRYPRIVGETGGKDFVFAHPSADAAALVTALVRGAFEYQGQKCSAASRAYVPAALWAEVKEPLVDTVSQLRMGPPTDFGNFLCAVIDRPAFDSISSFIDEANAKPEYDVLAGGNYDDSRGFFVEPTVVQTQDPGSRLMCEEIFGPVLTVYVYEEADIEQALDLCDTGSPYALTGAIFARDRRDIVRLSKRLRHAAGNFYINDKPTGAVVGQQPFGGARASGTNDKAGSPANLLRWVSQRTVKETFAPATSHEYPYMGDE